MTEKRDRLLPNAGGLLIAAGAIGAFVGGSHGLSSQRPGLILASVILLMGYGVVGYLLMNRGERSFQFTLPASAILVVSTLVLFRWELGAFLDDEIFHYVIEPALALLLVYAGGALLTHVVEDMTARVDWPGRGASSLNALMHVAAYAPVWCAFTLVDMLGGVSPGQNLMIIGGSVLAGTGCVVGGYAAARRSHPAFTVAGAAIGFLASAGYLYQFMLGGGRSGAAFFGQFNALIGLILTGLPLAIAAVAWIQAMQGADPADAEEPAR